MIVVVVVQTDVVVVGVEYGVGRAKASVSTMVATFDRRKET